MASDSTEVELKHRQEQSGLTFTRRNDRRRSYSSNLPWYPDKHYMKSTGESNVRDFDHSGRGDAGRETPAVVGTAGAP
jgi:hypothetical protein